MDPAFYDSAGEPVAYLVEGEHIYLFDGRPVAYLADDAVYAYSGRHLGYFNDGWIRDHGGDAVYFTENASGGPMRPLRSRRPIPAIREIRPIRGIREIRTIRAVRSLSWSPLSRGPAFFLQ